MKMDRFVVSSQSGTLWILLICLLALASRLAAKACASPGDAQEFHELGYNLATGHGFSIMLGVPTAYGALLYPGFVSGVCMVFGHNSIALPVVQSLLTTTLRMIMYSLVRG